MAKIRNTSGEDRVVPGIGGRLVLAGAVVEVDDADVYAYTCQEGVWSPVGKEGSAAHDAGAKAEAAAVESTPEVSTAADAADTKES